MDMNINAFISNAETTDNKVLGKENLLQLLKDKIECYMEDDKYMIVDVSEPAIGGCFHTIKLEDYIVDDSELYLVAGNFELHIDLKNMKSIEYDDALDGRFELKFDGIEVGLEFL